MSLEGDDTTMNLSTIFFVSLLSGAQSAWVRNYRDITDEEALEKAREILSNYPLTDGHNDLPWQYRTRVQNDVDAIDLSQDVNEQWGPSHTDIPRLRQGQVGAQFWSIYTECDRQYKDAVRATMEQADVIKRVIEKYPDDFELVRTADEIEDAFQRGKIGGLLAMEGGHSLDSSLAALRMFYDLGVRYMTLTHACTTPWADNSWEDDEEGSTHDGLTEWGKLVIQEMNRLGMLVDLSHVSKAAMLDVLEVSVAPVIFSHSNAWSLCNHNRNVQDDVIIQTAESGGIVMITFVVEYLNCFPTDQPVTDIPLVADHIEYIRDLVGADYVGIGSDYDGIESLPEGLDDVASFPYLFAELVKRGWSDLDLEKLAGRNLVRVFREVEQVRDQMQEAGFRPINTWIPDEDIEGTDECRTNNIQKK